MNTNNFIESQRVLLTGGRAPVTLDLARQLHKNGHTVFMAESCPVHLCIRSRTISRNFIVPKPNDDPDTYILSLLKIITDEQIDWLIPTCEEAFYVARGLQTLSKHCHVFIDSLPKLKRLHSKWDFIQTVTKAGLSVPETHLLQNKEDVRTALSLTGKWVYKREFSRFSSNVIIVDSSMKNTLPPLKLKKEDIPTTLFGETDPNANQASWVVQKFIEGTAYCSYSIAKKGKVTAHAVYPVEFTAGSGACISFTAIDHPAIENWVKQFVEAVNFTGQIAFDFIIATCGTIFPIECNPRSTSGLHLFQSGDRIDHAFFQHSNNNAGILKPNPNSKAMISLAMLSYGLFSIRSFKKMRRWILLLFRAKDITFRIHDPLPFFQQFSLLWWSVRLSKKKKISVMEATTFDIEWNGEE